MEKNLCRQCSVRSHWIFGGNDSDRLNASFQIIPTVLYPGNFDTYALVSDISVQKWNTEWLTVVCTRLR